MNTQDNKIDELTMEVMTHEKKDHIFLDMENKSLRIEPKSE